MASKSSTLKVVIAGDAKGATAAMSKVEGGATRMGSTVTGIGKRLGGLAIGAAIFGSIKQWEESNSVANSTAAVIKSTGNAAGVTAKQQDKMVQSLMNLSGIDDEVIAGGANMLRTFTSIKGVDVFGRSLTAATNMAAVFGGVQQSATLVGKALNDPIRGLTVLRKKGVEFTEDQKELVKGFVAVGDVASAQKVILQELETEYGGQAEANAKATDKIKVALGNAAEELGGVFAPALEATTKVVVVASQAFQALPKPVMTGALALGAMALVAPKIMAGMSGASHALDLFKMGANGSTVAGAGMSNMLGGLVAKAKTSPAAFAAMTAGTLGVVAALALMVKVVMDSNAALDAQAAKIVDKAGDGAVGIDRLTVAAAAANKEAGQRIKIGGLMDIFISGKAAKAGRQADILTDAIKDQYFAMAELQGVDDYTGKGPFLWLQRQNLLKGDAAAAKKAKEAEENLANGLKANATALEKANKAVQDRVDKLSKQRDAEQTVADAHTASREAQDDLAAAQKAATGDSEEYAAAQESITSAQEHAADAEKGVAEAQKDAITAQKDLNEARADAATRIRDLAAAARDARLEETRANLSARQAEREAQRAAANGNLTDLEREDIALRAQEAQAALANATSDRGTAEQEAAAAAAAGVEGDAAVISAKQGVKTANDNIRKAEDDVRDAVKGVAIAQAAAKKVIVDAKAEVQIATEKAKKAVMDEAKAWGDVVTLQSGAAAGVATYRTMLLQLTADLAPGSPLRVAAEALANDLSLIQGVGYATPIGPGLNGSPGPTFGPPAGAQPNVAPGRPVSDRSGRGGDLHVHLSGTPSQQKRAYADTGRDLLDKYALGVDR